MTHPLSLLPFEGCWPRPWRHRARPAVLCQLSRGVAPVAAIADTLAQAHAHGVTYWLIAGAPLIEAKNRAVDIARTAGADLIIAEDDILTNAETWARICEPVDAVRLVTTNCRDGSPNTRFDSTGAVLCSGNVLTAVPFAVLERLPSPVFETYRYRIAGDTLVRDFLRGDGRGSDTHFWASIRALDPRPAIEVVGTADHLMHSLNRESHDLIHPCEVQVA
jgi:hypothetical protein